MPILANYAASLHNWCRKPPLWNRPLGEAEFGTAKNLDDFAGTAVSTVDPDMPGGLLDSR
ncbi:hypothetical protein [Mycolicibacterium mengxianglii]|uniref:hypothetical protein n=1 Tax=Mycolicibacterium mengxianglii TaxID=2736649 RepID=UPI0018EEF0CC|nr:hypothetical protein [Mycolicibacterium mengxianglii]